MKSAIGLPESRAALPNDMPPSLYSAAAKAKRTPGSASNESSLRCTNNASGRWRFKTITGCSRASLSAAEGLLFNWRTLTAFIAVYPVYHVL